MGKPTRRERKRLRRAKAKKSPITNREIDKIAWAIADIIVKQQGSPIKHEAYYCSKCQQAYCENFTGTDSYCSECHYRVACLKVEGGGKICQKCERG